MPPSSVKPEIRELGDRIVALTLLEAKALQSYLRTAHGFEAAIAPLRGPAPSSDPPDPGTDDPVPGDPGAEGRPSFAVVLEAAGDDPIEVIKVLRAVTGMGLAGCKSFVEDLPGTVIENINERAAEALRDRLEAAGATARIE